MVFRTFLILVLAAGLSACANTATDANAEGDDVATASAKRDQTSAAAAGTEKPTMSCRREKTTGSRLGVRVCKVVSESISE